MLDNNKKEVSISIVISSIRPIKTLSLLVSLLKLITAKDEIIIFFDIPISSNIKNIYKTNFEDLNLKLIFNKENQGLSHNRNSGIRRAQNDFLIFFDDDVFLDSDVIKIYRNLFIEGYQVLGGPLHLPYFYPKIPSWLPKGLSSLLGIHTIQKRIWGGNWGIDLNFIRRHNLTFQNNLGRKGKGLQSGDESNFIEQVSKKGGKILFNENLKVMHCIDMSRFSLFYLLKRAFWQGKSEVRKKTIASGIVKDFKRSITTDNSQNIFRILLQKTLELVFFGSFLIGIFFEMLFGKGNNI